MPLCPLARPPTAPPFPRFCLLFARILFNNLIASHSLLVLVALRAQTKKKKFSKFVSLRLRCRRCLRWRLRQQHRAITMWSTAAAPQLPQDKYIKWEDEANNKNNSNSNRNKNDFNLTKYTRERHERWWCRVRRTRPNDASRRATRQTDRRHDATPKYQQNFKT